MQFIIKSKAGGGFECSVIGNSDEVIEGLKYIVSENETIRLLVCDALAGYCNDTDTDINDLITE